VQHSSCSLQSCSGAVPSCKLLGCCQQCWLGLVACCTAVTDVQQASASCFSTQWVLAFIGQPVFRWHCKICSKHRPHSWCLAGIARYAPDILTSLALSLCLFPAWVQQQLVFLISLLSTPPTGAGRTHVGVRVCAWLQDMLATRQ